MGRTLGKTVVMVGMMGAGKTAVGKALAHRLGVPFRDCDAEIEAAANRTVAEIFARDGEPFFREKESRVLERLLQDAPGVLSTGGGVFLSARNRALIAAHGVSVWLRADRALLWQRVRNKDTRPLLRTADPRATLDDLCALREPEYAKADVVVDSAADRSIEEMAARVEAALLDRPDLWEDPE
ncbi:shikimate kinase [Rhodosalinus sp. FB01]|uniref:shikimate kinase n=1 Tax=Rhodosalinus sp. FB01 TaxID=3239194 RepID=UPI003525F761